MTRKYYNQTMPKQENMNYENGCKHVFKRANYLTDHILERGCSLQLYKPLIVWVLFRSVKRISIIKLSHD